MVYLDDLLSWIMAILHSYLKIPREYLIWKKCGITLIFAKVETNWCSGFTKWMSIGFYWIDSVIEFSVQFSYTSQHFLSTAPQWAPWPACFVLPRRNSNRPTNASGSTIAYPWCGPVDLRFTQGTPLLNGSWPDITNESEWIQCSRTGVLVASPVFLRKI